MSGLPRSSRASGCTCPTIHRKARCAADTSRVHAACRGPARPIPTGASRTPHRCARSTRRKKDSRRATTSSRTAASASGHPTPGSCSPICLVTTG
jgi:hypothetical protein